MGAAEAKLEETHPLKQRHIHSTGRGGGQEAARSWNNGLERYSGVCGLCGFG
jgi:hypothetical protein